MDKTFIIVLLLLVGCGAPADVTAPQKAGADAGVVLVDGNGDVVTADTSSVTGAQGPQGEPGPEGPAGAVGPQGPEGPQGPAGAQGPQGPAGEMGPQGIMGPQGPAGDTGARGLQGFQGAQGPQGIQGIQGVAGPKGATGAAGLGLTADAVYLVDDKTVYPKSGGVASCDVGDLVLSGGCRLGNGNYDKLFRFGPVYDAASDRWGWLCDAVTTTNSYAQPFALCLDITP